MKNSTKTLLKQQAQCHEVSLQDDFFDRCLQQGLIKKDSYGYYFTPEFFEMLRKDSGKRKTSEKKLSVSIQKAREPW